MQITREQSRIVQRGDLAQSLFLRLQHPSPQLKLPKDRKSAALVVVVETDKIHPGLRSPAIARGRRDHRLDQILPLARMNDIADLGSVAKLAARPARGVGTRRLRDLLAVSFEESGCQSLTSPSRVVEVVCPARGSELVASEVG